MTEQRGEDWERAERLLAYGHHHRMLLRPLYAGEEEVFPRFALRAEGYEIVDDRGRRFVDWANGWGPVLLGYAHPAVEKAIRDQLTAGPTLSLMHPVELDVAEQLVRMIPCAEMVAFGKNGSDTLTAAVRIARAHTGRDVILFHGFHGFHDWYVGRYPDLPGQPRDRHSLLAEFPYNDLPALDALFERFQGRVAAVVMEPTNTQLPEKGYLEGVRERTRRHGALLIFDEMVTGFRLANGGAQELFGVVPDLGCFGKGLANGMPLSAVVGPRRLMRVLPHLAYGMTFRGETLSLAAARQVLRTLEDEPVAAHLDQIGAGLRVAFFEECEGRGLCGFMRGPNARISVDFANQGGVEGGRLLAFFLRECARRGVLSHGTFLPSYAHDDRALDLTRAAFAGAFDAIERALSDRTARRAPGSGLDLLGSPRGWLEGLSGLESGGLHVVGWMLVDDARPDAIELVTTGGERVQATWHDRFDVAAAYPLAQGADRCGFEARLPESLVAAGDAWEFEIHALRAGNPIYRCSVLCRRRSPGGEALKSPRDLSTGSVFV